MAAGVCLPRQGGEYGACFMMESNRSQDWAVDGRDLRKEVLCGKTVLKIPGSTERYKKS